MKSRIKQIRKEAHLNQTDFGARIGVKQTTVAAYECGARVPLDAIVTSICREFNVSEAWLRTGEGSPREPLTEVDQLSAEFHLDGERRAVLEEFCRMKPEAQAYILDFLESVGNRLHAERAAKKKAAAKTQREADAEKQADLKARILLEEEAAEKSSVSNSKGTESATG